jgi:chorismate synthase
MTMALNLDEVRNEIDHLVGTLECEFENVIENEGDEYCLDRLDAAIGEIMRIRDDLREHYS